jgi:AbrB family looped-hinge helix DNA binding protein
MMSVTKMSSKGQVVIPKTIRTRYKWNPGQELQVIDTGDGIALKSARPFTPTTLNQVARRLTHTGRPVSLEEMEAAIKKGAREQKS